MLVKVRPGGGGRDSYVRRIGGGGRCSSYPLGVKKRGLKPPRVLSLKRFTEGAFAGHVRY